MSQDHTTAVILTMGATGTGKSTFINLLTGDDNIHIGHSQQSETFGVETAHYVDQATGHTVRLIDTPGFDDSREGVTDTDILEKIARFLVPESGEKIDITGIIYMHRISDPRVGGVSRKNIKVFYSLCGETNLGNVRIVTTNWSRVTENEGNHREADLKNGAFKGFVDAGAQMWRHTDTLESAQQIMSELVSFSPVALAIQEELRDGKKLVDTSAGTILEAEMQTMRKKHEQELADLEKELKDAEDEQTHTLIAELEQEREALQEKIKRANVDRQRLESTLVAACVDAPREQVNVTEPYGRSDDASEVLMTVWEPPKDTHQATDRSSRLHTPGVEAVKPDVAKLVTTRPLDLTFHPVTPPIQKRLDDERIAYADAVKEPMTEMQMYQTGVYQRFAPPATSNLAVTSSHRTGYYLAKHGAAAAHDAPSELTFTRPMTLTVQDRVLDGRPLDTSEQNAPIAEMQRRYEQELADRDREIAQLKEKHEDLWRRTRHASSASRTVWYPSYMLHDQEADPQYATERAMQALEDRIRDAEKKRAERVWSLSNLWTRLVHG